MGVDDDTGWNEVLLEMWSPDVRAAVVRRIEGAMTRRHGWLVRTFNDPDGAPPGLTELVHRVVMAAIRDETGADLEQLGSQAAWECYEQVWDRLAVRWETGGSLGTVPLGHEARVIGALRALPLEAAVAAGADGSREPPDPLWLQGRLRIDVIGLRAHLSLDGGPVPGALAEAARVILEATPTPTALADPAQEAAADETPPGRSGDPGDPDEG